MYIIVCMINTYRYMSTAYKSMPYVVAITCPSNSAGTDVATGDCTCNAGFSGTIVATTTAPYYSGSCTENSCAAYPFSTGVVGGDTDPCSDNIVLNTQSDSSCNIQCGAGYVTQTGTIACASDADANDATSGDISCAAASCPSNSAGTDVPAGCTCNTGYSGTIASSVTSPFFSGSCAGMTLNEPV